ncbi:MAG: LD-carboxypeptidase [Deltaproteobacteria bacterium]|nr:LD-carboxypeptidase [Deltaproteobacteria bacterium]
MTHPPIIPPPLKRPPPLRRGDRVALISPSSHQGTQAPFLEAAVDVLTGWGLKVDPLPNPEPRYLYLAGPDEERARRFLDGWLDPQVKGLFFSRGGYGASRILPWLDANRFAAAPPKWVVGFSDATALFAWMAAKGGVMAMHGPCMAQPGALTAPRRGESLDGLRQVLFDPFPGVRRLITPFNDAARQRAGVRGRLVGGCLSVWMTTLATPWEVDPGGTVLFLEDIEEPPYKIDRMFTHLRQAGGLEGVSAVVLGYFNQCDSDPPELLGRVWEDLFGQSPIPVFSGLAAGHGDPNLSLPLGGEARVTVADDRTAWLEVE